MSDDERPFAAAREAALMAAQESLAKLKTTSTEPAPNPRRQLLLDAADIIDGDRNETYGGPEQSFTVIAEFWSTYLGFTIQPSDVAAMMALLKIARIKGSGGKHKDSWTDGAGYFACGWECVEAGK
jgi:hypothetical protein